MVITPKVLRAGVKVLVIMMGIDLSALLSLVINTFIRSTSYSVLYVKMSLWCMKVLVVGILLIVISQCILVLANTNVLKRKYIGTYMEHIYN